MDTTPSPDSPIPEIISFFEGLPQKIFWPSDISRIRSRNRRRWRISGQVSDQEFREFLLRNTQLRRVVLKSDRYSNIERYTWGSASISSVDGQKRPLMDT